jgi:hypothetical protein
MPALPITRVVLYKHGVGYFEREGQVDGDESLTLTFKQAEVSDVLKSMTILDLANGHIASVSYDSTKPLEQLLDEVALVIPDENSLVGLLPQIKGARLSVQPVAGGSMAMRPASGGDKIEGTLLGVDRIERQTAEGVVRAVQLSLLTDDGGVRSFDLQQLANLHILDATVRRDLDYYLRTQLAAKKKDTRTFTFFAKGEGKRGIRLSYTVESPVWKATYRIILGEESRPPLIQGWAVVDNTQDEDWENIQLSLVAGLPVSFVHDLYTPRYIRRPVVEVKETTGVLPPELEAGMMFEVLSDAVPSKFIGGAPAPGAVAAEGPRHMVKARRLTESLSAPSSTPAQVRERKIGDLFEYEIEHPVTIRRNQSALVPIVLRSFEGRPVLLYNKATRTDNPLRCVDLKNTTGLTLEGGPVTVLESGCYVGEAMLETTKPDEHRIVPYAVELSVGALDNLESQQDAVSRVVIRRGMLQAHHTAVQQTTYSFNNKGDAEATLYLEHPRGNKEWRLIDTADPHETTENYWRFRLPLPPRRITKFVVRQRRPLASSFALTDTTEEQLTAWLDQRYVDKVTAQVLRQVLHLRQKASELDREMQRLTKDRDHIHTEQKRIRENLGALGDRPSEKELRERFVRILNGQEDRLEQIEKTLAEHSKSRDRWHEQIDELLAKLEYEAEL